MVGTTREEVINRVRDQLIWDARVRASDVNVSIDHGNTVLTGTVPSYRAKIAATEDAWSVSGVTNVDNRLRVQYPPTIVSPGDEQIRSNVENALTLDPDIDTDKIEITVSGGVVTLIGTVDAFWKRFQVASDAYWAVGVIDVVNELAVISTDKRLDEAIARDIEAAFDRHVNINPDLITVTVADGVVTLTGTVPTWLSWQATYNTAKYTTGVIDVVDEINISYT